MSGPRAPGFRITDSKGFHVTFENGWTVSVQFGPGNYGSNYDAEISRAGAVKAGERGSSTAEIAAFRAGTWHKFENGDSVDGYRSPAGVLAFLNEISQLPAQAEALS